MSGLFVGVLSSGTAISFGVDATAPPYENENAAYFSLATICWPILAFVAWKCTTDTNYMKEDTVIVPLHVRKAMHLEGESLSQEASKTVDVEGKEKLEA